MSSFSRSALDRRNENDHHSIVDLQTVTKHKQSSHVAGAAPRTPQRISSRILLGRGGELIIEHCGREYRLRLTQNGKLILTA